MKTCIFLLEIFFFCCTGSRTHTRTGMKGREAHIYKNVGVKILVLGSVSESDKNCESENCLDPQHWYSRTPQPLKKCLKSPFIIRRNFVLSKQKWNKGLYNVQCV
jgi:hypothetical protein